MQIRKLDHNKNYEWVGTFWFPAKPAEQFAGKVSYSPENGIKLSFTHTSHSAPQFATKQIMNGIVIGEESAIPISLINVLLQKGGIILRGKGSYEELRGSAEVIVANKLLDNPNISGLSLEYDDNFFNTIMYHKDISTAVKFFDNPAIVEDISFSISYIGWFRGLSAPDDFDNILGAYAKKSKKIMKDFKKLVAPFLEKHKYELHSRADTDIVLSIKSKYKSFDKYRIIEYTWRAFWEMLCDYPITILHCWISIPERAQAGDGKEKIYRQNYPVLVSMFRNQTLTKKPSHYLSMPITLKVFGEKNHDLSVLNTPLNKWFDVKNKRESLFVAVRDMVYNRNQIIRQKDYVILLSHIETLISTLPKQKHIKTIDDFIGHYTTRDILATIKRMSNYKKSIDKNLGNCIAEIRNVIVHTNAKGKSNGKYDKIANSEIRLQNLYGNLAGLFIKAFMNEIFVIPSQNMKKYMDSFIMPRASFRKLKYSG